VAPENSLNALTADALWAELEPLGSFLDAMETRNTKLSPAQGAEKYQRVAKRARGLIDRGLDLPPLRKHCLRSPALYALLEAALFDRAASRGRLQLGTNWSTYGR
jgi:hypothetical protein